MGNENEEIQSRISEMTHWVWELEKRIAALEKKMGANQSG